MPIPRPPSSPRPSLSSSYACTYARILMAFVASSFFLVKVHHTTHLPTFPSSFAASFSNASYPSVFLRKRQLHPETTTAAAAQTQHAQAHTPRERRRATCVDNDGFVKGKWVYRPNATRPHAHYKHIKSHLFTRPELAFRQEFPLEKGWDTYYMDHNQYDFEPFDPLCALSEWSYEHACHVLDKAANGSRRILFVGDSISYTMALSFLQMMRGTTITSQSEWAEQTLCADVLEGRPVYLHFIRNDNLYPSPVRQRNARDDDSSKKTRTLTGEQMRGIDFTASRPWTTYYEGSKPDVVVLNLGTHVHSLEYFQVLLDDTLDYLQQEMRERWRRSRFLAEEEEGKDGDSGNEVFSSSPLSSSSSSSPRLFFRTTAAGHPECTKYTHPIFLEEGREAETYAYNFEGKYSDKFTWHLIDSYNHYMEKRVKEVFAADAEEEKQGRHMHTHTDALPHSPPVTVMKLHQVSHLRPDGHVGGETDDCLHYLLPGVPDSWTRIFIDILEAMNE